MTRVVMFVLNDCRQDARVLREAATLAGAGYQVTIVARTSEPYAATGEREERDGFTIVRVPLARGPMRLIPLLRAPRASLGAPRREAAEVARRPARWPLLAFRGIGSLLAAPLLLVLAAGGALARSLGAAVPPLRWAWRGLEPRLQWRFAVLPWARAAAEAAVEAAPGAEILHAHDLRALPAALAARDRAGGRIVYDSHEIFVEAGANATRPGWAKHALRGLERRLAREATALVTVNDELARLLGHELALERVVVVRNCPPRWDPPAVRPDLLRAAAGIPPAAPVVLYHGALAPDRGVEQLIGALRQPGLDDAHLAILGFGPSRRDIERLAADPASGGRCHVLEPVPPEDLPAWVASADVVAAPIQPTTLNHRLSTPNKLFEGLAAGVPVVASDFPAMRRIILEDPVAPLGAVCDPTSPIDLARALGGLLGRPPEERERLRRRCLEAAHERWNWEAESAKLLRLYAELLGETALGANEGPLGQVPQRVTFVLPTTGEHDSRTRRIAAALAARGHEVTMLARAGPGLRDDEVTEEGFHVVRLAAGTTTVSGSPVVSGPARLVAEARRMLGTARHVGRQARAASTIDRGADLYHAMGFLALPVGLRLAARWQAPLVYDARDIYAASNNVARLPRPLRRLFLLRERTWARRAARVFTVNEACADYLAASLNVPRPAVVMNAQGPWTPPEEPPDLLRDALALAADTPLVLYHGGFMPDRGLPETIAVMGEPGLERAHLVLLGSGIMEAQLRRLAAEPAAGGRVHLLPPVAPDELLPWVASADVGVMLNQPRTLNERLSTPNKLFECLAAGVPVLSSDFPERRRIIIDDPDGTLGAVCDPTDRAAIGAALRGLLELDPDERAELRARCLRAAHARYAWDRQFEVVLAEYEALTGRLW